MKTSERGELSLSFLDVLSCSLGAGILLFLIFSSLEHHGDRRSREREGLIEEGASRRVGRTSATSQPTAVGFLIEVSHPQIVASSASQPASVLSVKAAPEAASSWGMLAEIPLEPDTAGETSPKMRPLKFILLVPDSKATGTLSIPATPGATVVVRIERVFGGRGGCNPVEWTLEAKNADDLRYSDDEIVPDDPNATKRTP